MNLTKEQIDQFNKDGYLFFPSLFTQEEIQNLIQEDLPFIKNENTTHNQKIKFNHSRNLFNNSSSLSA